MGGSLARMLTPHPEERALARVSKDGCESLRCVHPSRRLLRKLLRMRSVFFTDFEEAVTRPSRRMKPPHWAQGFGILRAFNRLACVQTPKSDCWRASRRSPEA